MKINFEDITFRNILSFGHKPTTINFKNGLNLITGKNGSGKSTALLDALCFCLYGKPYRDINIDKIINRKNKKDVEVTVKFSTNKDSYEITRGIKPKKFIIKKNNTTQKKLSSTKLNQEEVDKILGIDHKLFKQIISLSINHNEPFLSLGVAKKREILDQIGRIDIFASMLKQIKSEIKDLKIKIGIKEKEVLFSDNHITNEKKRIEDIKKTKKNFDKDRQKDLDGIDDKISTYQTKLDEIKSEGKITKIGTVLKDTRPELQEQKTKHTEDIAEQKYIIKQAVKDKDFLESNDVCPTCNAEFKDKDSELQSLIASKLNAETKIEMSQKELDIINESITRIEDNINEVRDIKLKLASLKDKFINIQSEIKELKDRRTDIVSRKFDIDIDAMDKGYEEYLTNHKVNKSELDELKDEFDIAVSVSEVLSDTGIKSYVLEQLIPILNYNINEYLRLFDLSVSIEFDKFMEVIIKTLNGHGEDESYYAFSEGEKKRIDMAILLSFIGVTKSLANWNCNLLVIDELLDSSIDDDGLEKLIESLESMVNDSGNLGVYIISHRMKKEYSNQFNSLIEVKKNSNEFSEIRSIK